MTDAAILYAYAGSRTTRERHARGQGISVFAVDADTGDMHCVQQVGGLTNPSFLAINHRGDRLYTVHGDQQEVSAFAIDAATGHLSVINQRPTQGHNPVHLAISPCGGYLVVSNHGSGSLAVLPIAPDGALQPSSQLVPLEGDVGPHRIEQRHAKPHANPFDPSGRFVVVPDKGLDRIFVLRFEHGRLSAAQDPWVAAREGAGPRHIAFHPRAPLAWCINELDSTVTGYRFDPQRGSLVPFQMLSTLPDTYTGNSRAAEIEVDPTGRFVYATNRGYDSIAVFAIDAPSGRLRPVQYTPSGGRTPRFATRSPSGQHFYALNEDSDAITLFTVDAVNGALHPTGRTIACGSPVCLVFRPPRDKNIGFPTA